MFTSLKKLYSLFWVPFFGRILTGFVRFIEGKEPTLRPTFDIDSATERNDEEKNKL